MVLSGLSTNTRAQEMFSSATTSNTTDEIFVRSVAYVLAGVGQSQAFDGSSPGTLLSNPAGGAIDLNSASSYLDHVQFAQDTLV